MTEKKKGIEEKKGTSHHLPARRFTSIQLPCLHASETVLSAGTNRTRKLIVLYNRRARNYTVRSMAHLTTSTVSQTWWQKLACPCFVGSLLCDVGTVDQAPVLS